MLEFREKGKEADEGEQEDDTKHETDLPNLSRQLEEEHKSYETAIIQFADPNF